jgi:hypothetical protein
VKGFAILDSPSELDVVAVYTTAGATKAIETFFIERVQPRKKR